EVASEDSVPVAEAEDTEADASEAETVEALDDSEGAESEVASEDSVPVTEAEDTEADASAKPETEFAEEKALDS
ncbi:MAG: hypothetical protein O7G87_02855, partial [bacterium]|nr:hypothetical protein [bacterium]